MKRRRDIYADGGRREFERARASRDVKIYLLVAAGAFGLPLIMTMAQCSADDEPPAPQVASSQTYANNSFLPGAGYYHAPYHAWFPVPYNQHDVRGWYRGGQWRAQPYDQDPNQVSFGGSGSYVGAGSSGFTNSSRPTPEAVAQANRAASDYHASTIRRGGFGGSSRSFFS